MQRQGFDESLRLKKIFSMFGIGCPTSRKVPKINLKIFVSLRP
jgi:hypothetical protein